VRGPSSSPHKLGLDRSLEFLADLLDDAMSQAGLVRADGPVAEVARVQLAGVDEPDEEEQFQDGVERSGWAMRVFTGNDTLAVLRSGTDRGWGVAVVCGAGINGVGVAPDGRSWRFPALGSITGDWGGSGDVGLAALGAAARSADGRGPATVLERSVPEHFGLSSPVDVARAIFLRRMPDTRLEELAPVVLGASTGDAVAAAIVDRLADEISDFACATIDRLGLAGEEFEVVLGGGLVRRSPARLLKTVRARVAEVAPHAHALIADAPPIAGAALLALDDLGSSAEVKANLRRALVEAEHGLPEVPWDRNEDGNG
jgi:N-acetylglucosamine kinase-like BadF-type ATPase